MRTGSLVMHEGPLPVQQQPNRHIHPQAVGVALGDLQGQVPLLTQSSNSKLRTMSEPVPLLCHAQILKELKMDISSPCNTVKLDLNSSEVAPGTGLDMEVSDLGYQVEAEFLKHGGAISPQQQEGSPIETSLSDEFLPAFSPALDKSSCNHLPAYVNAPEDSSLDLLRIVKHKPSAIVFCDYDFSSDNQVIIANESSDGGESSSSTTEEGEGDDDGDEKDDFPETLKYKEFLVSRRRRNLSRNRKHLRMRKDAQPNSSASIWQKATDEGKPEFTGSQEEEDTLQNNGKQVRKTRQ